ncbi:MAG: type VII secretion target [Aeromicrobium sp.]
MPDLSVDVEGLGRMATAMREVADGLDDTRSVIDGAGDAMGSSDVLDALEDFEDHWKDGRGRITDNLEDMEKVLEDSMQAYQDVDQDLTDSLTKKEATTTRRQGGGM